MSQGASTHESPMYRVHPIFFGQAAARRALQSKKLSQRMFSVQHSTAGGALPRFRPAALASLSKENGMDPHVLCQDGSNMFQLPRSNACAAARASSVIDPPASIRPISSTRSGMSNLDMLMR